MKLKSLIKKTISTIIDKNLATVMSLYPPYLGAGVRVEYMDDQEVRVRMVFKPWNKNYVGTQFGGSLYSMCDPFFMLLMMRQLGPDYIVWDKAASIRFRKPGRSAVRATFRLEPAEVERVRQLAHAQPTVEPVYTVEVLGQAGELVASVEKTLYVKWRGHDAR
jgi:acyl-coenzyme A thioesterase PaaI-like protein